MSEPPWIWQCEQVIPSTLGAIAPVRQEVLGQMESHQWGKHDIFSVHLALDEALTNAARHGNHLDPAKSIHFACRLAPEVLQIEVVDEGNGFDPDVLPDPTACDRIEHPGGRGVMLMRSFMDRVEYNAPGNRVLLEKRRTPAD